MPWHIYIIRCKGGLLYTGITNDLDRRINQHFKKKSFTTKKMLPMELVFVQVCDSRKEARELEKYFKSGTGREIINDIIL